MSMYPSLEDMKFDQVVTAQEHAMLKEQNEAVGQQMNYIYQPQPQLMSNAELGGLYPQLDEFMGLELSEVAIPEITSQLAVPQAYHRSTSNVIAPLSNRTDGLIKAGQTNGIRQLILCKDKDGKVGLRVAAVDNGIFVCLVVDKSPAVLAGLRFGDQILQINGKNVAGFTMDKVHEILRKAGVNNISVVVRDRPFERTVTLHKDSHGNVGFQFKNGKIVSLVKDSSAARNGLLTNHQMVEVDGQNVVGMKDKNILKIIEKCDSVVTVTILPSTIYDHMIKKMSTGFMKTSMDHSVPAV